MNAAADPKKKKKCQEVERTPKKKSKRHQIQKQK
jgi:hypothetical protein